MRFNQVTIWRIAMPAALVLMAGLSGCSSKYSDLKVFLRAHENEVSATSYQIEPPDVIQIISPTCPEVDNQIQRIRSDGKLSLKLLGEVYVCGQTPRELAAKLEGLLSRYYESPKVNVSVASHESKHVYVFGQVSRRGAMPFTGRDTLLNVIAAAQPNFLAWGAKVKVIRPGTTPDEQHEIVVDVDKMIKTGDMKNNILLQEGDIVYVPPTPLGWVGLRIQEVLFPISPALSTYNSGATFSDTTDRYQNGNNDQSSNNGSNRLMMLR